MAKALTMPTAPEAPMAPQVSIGDRIHSIENRIEEIEGISGMNGVSKSRNGSDRQSQQEDAYEESEEEQEEQEETQPQAAQQPRKTQSAPKVQQSQPSSRNVTTPENMARDAVANGSGALTKRTTTRAKDDAGPDSDSGSQSKNQTTVVIPPNSILNDNGQTSFERGRAVLNEFKELDRESQTSSSDTQSSTSTPGLFAPSRGSESEHGAAYWIFTLVAVAIMAFFFIRQFLNNRSSSEKPFKPSLSKPQISSQAAINQYTQNKPASVKPSTQNPKPTTSPVSPSTTPISAPPIPKVKPATLKSKPAAKAEDENKGKHFEVRV